MNIWYMFGSNPAKNAMPFYDQIPGKVQPYQQPYIDYGNSFIDTLKGQYNDLITNPNGVQDKIGQGYQQSPGFKNALQQAMQATANSSAAGGMAGTRAADRESADMATDMANKDYNTYVDRSIGLYNTGLQGGERGIDRAQNASDNMSQIIAQMMGQKANLTYQGGVQQQQNMKDWFGLISKAMGLGGFAPGLPGMGGGK